MGKSTLAVIKTGYKNRVQIPGTNGFDARYQKPQKQSVSGAFLEFGVPNGIRTRVATLKGWCPRPLDDGDVGAVKSGHDITVARREIKGCAHLMLQHFCGCTKPCGMIWLAHRLYRRNSP